MLTLTTFIEALIVSGTVIGVTYCLMLVTAYCVLRLIDLSFKPSGTPQRHANPLPLRMLPKTNSAAQMKFLSQAMRQATKP
jgi:hypothetical protein